MALSSAETQDQQRSDTPSRIYANTSFGGLIYKACATNQPITVPQYTTLNEYFDKFAEESLGRKNGRDFELKYFSLGIRGSNCYGTHPNGVSRMRVNGHQPIDQNLFTIIPICARPLSAPLDADTRDKYRMRVELMANGEMHEFFYAKLISFANYNPKEVTVTVDQETSNKQVKDLIHQKDDLMNPEPPAYTPNGTVPVAKQYANGSAILDCSLSASDLAEIVNAMNLHPDFGDASMASISELMISWGIDTRKEGNIANGVKIRYMEALSMNAAHFVSERDGRSADGNSLVTLRFDHGNSDPMLLSSTPTTSTTGN